MQLNRDLFDALSLYEDISRRARRALDSIGTLLDLKDGTVIDREGFGCLQLVVILRGTATITAGGALQGLLIRGDVWGDAGVSGSVSSRTLAALGQVRVHAFSVHEFRVLRAHLPTLAEQLLWTGTANAGLRRPPSDVRVASRSLQVEQVVIDRETSHMEPAVEGHVADWTDIGTSPGLMRSAMSDADEQERLWF
jgi:hypothetical protein